MDYPPLDIHTQISDPPYFAYVITLDAPYTQYLRILKMAAPLPNGPQDQSLESTYTLHPRHTQSVSLVLSITKGIYSP